MPDEKSETKQKSEAPRRVQPAFEADFAPAEYARTVYVLTAAEGVTPEDLLNPDYWCHLGEKLREWDRIEARSYSGDWFAEYMVRSAGRLYANVVLRNKTYFADAKVPEYFEKSAYGVRFIRGQGHAIFRKSDKQIIHAGFRTVAEAVAWAGENLRVAA